MINKSKIVFLVLCLIHVGSINLFAQLNSKKDPSPVFWGGNVGLNFSNHYWLVNLSPMVGYQLTPSFSMATGVIYQYESDSRLGYHAHSYGINALLRYDLSANLMKNLPFGIFFQTDYEGTQNNIRYKNFPNQDKFINRLFLGTGIISTTSRSRVFVMVSFDMLDLNREDGVIPVLRGGVFF